MLGLLGQGQDIPEEVSARPETPQRAEVSNGLRPV
jgi:hypothetical protein